MATDARIDLAKDIINKLWEKAMRVTVPAPTPVVPLYFDFDDLVEYIMEGAAKVAEDRFTVWRESASDAETTDPTFVPNLEGESWSGSEDTDNSMASWYSYDFDSISESNIIGPR